MWDRSGGVRSTEQSVGIKVGGLLPPTSLCIISFISNIIIYLKIIFILCKYL